MHETSDHPLDTRLDGFGDFIRETMQTWHVPGLAVAVVKNDDVLFLEGFGVRDTEQQIPITPRTLFALASGTKAFTTMALGLLVDEGKLEWDVPVRRYLPSFKLYDAVMTERITPRDMVTHRSGLPRHDLAWYNSPYDRAELVRRMQFLEPNQDLRAQWQYQNLMYMAAGYLIEQITGLTWEAFVRQRIFAPLGMEDSNFTVTDSEAAPDYALPYEEKDGAVTQLPFYRQFAVGPAGSINTNVAGMANWLRVHLNKGEYAGQRLISEAQLRDMHTPQMVMQRPLKYSELSHASYGLGWMISSYRGHEFIEHGGNIDGFSTMTTLMPRDGLGVVVLANLNSSRVPWIVCVNAYERLLGLDATPWTERFKAEQAEGEAGEEAGKEKNASDRVPETQPSHPLAAYAGEYEHPGYGILAFELVGDALQARYNDTTLPVEHYHYDTFELLWERWDARYKATFAADVRGDIVSVTVPFERTVSDIVFTRIPDRAMSRPEFLTQFTGDYEALGVPLSIMLKGEQTLLARLPGQPDAELVPRKGTEFVFKHLSGFSIEFVQDEHGTVTEAIVSQPGFTIHATRR